MAAIATGNREDALDLVQEAMLRLAHRYGHRGADEWGPLFHRILQSRIRDWYRRTQVRNRWRVWLDRGEDREANDPLDNQPGSPAENPDSRVAGDRWIEHLDAALHELPLRQQQAFLLRSWEGMDVAQTAKAMGCSQGSVKTHYSRAVHALRDLLQEHAP